MYICSECGLKFKNKVDYCDCGNDTFEYIEDKPVAMTLEQKAELISKLFFLFCLLMAVLVWFIPIKNDSSIPETKKQEPVNIQDINKIWDDTPPYQAPAPIKPEMKTLSDLLEPLPPKKVKIQPKVEPKISSEPQPKVLKQPVQQKVQPVNETPKVIQKPQQNINKTETKQKVESSFKQPEKPVYNPNSPEMIRYKTNLRAALFSRFAVGSIQGSGTCEIQFSIDPTGKLINRKFTKESDNKTLNDTVYYMLMSVPRFSAPPSGYNGEPIKMNFSINNGNYEISIY